MASMYVKKKAAKSVKRKVARATKRMSRRKLRALYILKCAQSAFRGAGKGRRSFRKRRFARRRRY